MKVEEIIVPVGLSIAALAILSTAAKATEIKKDVLIVTGRDGIITESQINELTDVIRSRGIYQNVYWLNDIDISAHGGDDQLLTGVELVKYLIKFLCVHDPFIDGVIIISNGKEFGGIPPPSF